ncbi:hypothetical protein [Chryseobacterium sp. CT-SW4]|uniref:hypothetical protein n=1 Tax=Chryseobacterium sp. SW-1 TaxID=3157343 RepID=UPI003B01ABFD
MIKKIIPWLFPTALCLLILNSCSTEDDYLKSNDEQYTSNKFQVFTEQNGITVNYADGFKTLMERYDSLYNVSHTAKAMKTSFSRSETVSAEYIEFNIRSQEFTTDKGEKYVLFPLIRDYQVAGIMVAALKDEETFVEFYEMSSDEKNYSEILSLFTAQYLKSTVNNRLNKYACGFPGYPACDIEGIIITVPKSGGNGNGLPSGGSGGTSGGCSIYENCMDGNLDGGGGGLPELQISPCLRIKNMLADPTLKSKINALDQPNILGLDHEMGYAAGYPPKNTGVTGTQYQPMENGINTHSVSLPTGNHYFGFIHTHNNEHEGNTTIKIFSPYDLITFLTNIVRNAEENGDISDAYAIVITSQGSYILLYSGLGDYGIGPNQIKNWKEWYQNEFQDLVNTDNLTASNVEKTFARFLNESVKLSGLAAYKFDKNTGSVGKLNSTGNPTPCN